MLYCHAPWKGYESLDNHVGVDNCQKLVKFLTDNLEIILGCTLSNGVMEHSGEKRMGGPQWLGLIVFDGGL